MKIGTVRLLSAASLGVLSVLPTGGQAAAAGFTGPLSPYYLDNYDNSTIYVVQGTSVINSFAEVYANSNGTPFQEDLLAVTNVVSTNWFGSFYGAQGTAGQYTLGGTPTGTSWTNSPNPPGSTAEDIYDGTSDGTHNYTVEYAGTDSSGNATENVIQTDLNWQNPVTLFSVQSGPGACCEKLGITYDPANNSLWVSGWETTTVVDYDLSGNVLSSFDTGMFEMDALAYDSADGTLWLTEGETNSLFQYSTSGVFLQTGVPDNLPGGSYLAGEMAETAAMPAPEPASLALLGAGLTALGIVRRRKKA